MANADDTPDQTARLREIFLDVAETPTVTESQRDSHGSRRRQGTDEPLAAIVREMCAEYDIRTSLDEAELVVLVRLFHEGHSDTAIARSLGDENRDRTVARARINLHLFRESDFDAPFDLERLQGLIDDDATTAEMARILEVSKSTVRAYRRMLAAKREAMTGDHTYRDRFREVLMDEDTARPESVRDTLYDGLADAIDSTSSGG